MNVIPFEPRKKNNIGKEEQKEIISFYELQETLNVLELKISRQEEILKNLSYLDDSDGYRRQMKEKMELEYERVITEKKMHALMKKMMEESKKP